MYWMLLPPSANAERHLEPKTVPLRDFWIHKLNASWARTSQGRPMREPVLHVLCLASPSCVKGCELRL